MKTKKNHNRKKIKTLKKIGGWEGEINNRNKVAIFETLRLEFQNIKNAIRDLDERVGNIDGKTQYYSL